MKVFDIVRVVGPSTLSSHPPNSRVLVDHHDDRAVAEDQCCLFNDCRSVTDYHYAVEAHNELSARRAMPSK